MPTEELLKRVTIDPQVCHGKPCIRGLRYPVSMLLELMSEAAFASSAFIELDRDGVIVHA